MVKPSYSSALGGVAMVALSAALAGAVTLSPRTGGEAGTTNPQTTTGYDNTPGQPERIKGKIVCVRATPGFSPQSASECPGGEDALALAVADSDAVQRLIAVDGKTQAMLVDLMGERVVIEGKRYEGSGTIMASTVLSEAEAK